MLQKVFKTKWQGEGVGASVRRAIGVSACPDLDPFLMLDFFKVRLPAGFPDHPHRGFETVTYMIEGTFKHEDFKGNAGIIRPGDVQWMTAGKGIVHAEMPGSKDEDSIGFQLWINLPKGKKMIEPHYQEVAAKDLPVYKDKDKKVVVIAGEYQGVKAVIKPASTTHYYDVHLQPGQVFEHVIPAEWNALVYPYGSASFSVAGKNIEADNACVLEGMGDTFTVKNLSGDQVAKFIILYGKPLKEPISRYGPFVMSSDEEIEDAFTDYKRGKNGFENAHVWESEIKDLANL